ncbi:MAG: TIM barrel protein [Planctomycetota bacterium]|nr:TIM barrel protein [Planctomycetota bacterium]
MPILTHGSDLKLAPMIRPIVRQAGGAIRDALKALGEAGFTSVQLDAALPGIRPRDLDRRARHDLVAMLGRSSMTIAGIDLFIPRRHFIQGEHLDRAISAMLAAAELAADLGKVPLSVALPVKSLTDDTRKTLVEAADGRGIRLAVHAEDQLEELLAWVQAVDVWSLGAAIDPAALLSRGTDPAATVHRIGKRLAVARVDDLAMTSSEPGVENDDPDAKGAGVRSYLGEGDLDLDGYRVAVDLAPGRTGPVVLDLRGIENPMAGAVAARAAWEHAAFSA